MRWMSLLLVAACGQKAAPQRTIRLEPCRLKSAAVPAQCGFLDVPQDRAHPEGRRLQLKVAVVPALAHDPAPDPLFLLAGGPGQSALEALGPLLPVFERIRRTRDLVLVDQRGTGSSSPLECELSPADAPLDERLRGDFDDAPLRKCAQSYAVDPRFFTTTIAMQDLDAVRAALGYDRINLWGGSYGTRAALVYLRDHGEHVRTAVLDGVAPYALKLGVEFAPDAQRAMDLLFAACRDSASCAKAFPDLPNRFAALLASLEKSPPRVAVQDPLTGAPTHATISRDAFTGALRGILYQQDFASLVPLIIDRAARGDFAPFVAASAGLSGGFQRTMSIGLLFSIVCAEDIPFAEPGEIARKAQGTFLGPRGGEEFARVCSFWPHAPPQPHEAVRSDKPVLLLSGELDPVTPPSWAAEAARTLGDSVQVTVPGVGHGATGEGCVPQLIAQVLEKGSVKGLDTGCVKALSRPPFFVSFAGPTP